MEFSKIEDTSQMTPSELSDYRLKVSVEYAFWSDRLAEIISRKAPTWMKLRENSKSDKATDRAWECTEDGVNETSIRQRLKGWEKLLSGLNTRITVLQGESRNLF